MGTPMPWSPRWTLVAWLGLGCSLNCMAPAGLGLPDAVSSSGTTVLAFADQDPSAIDPEEIELRLIGAEANVELAIADEKSNTLELACFDAQPNELGLDATLHAVARDAANKAHLPLQKARRFFSNTVIAGVPEGWVERQEPTPLLAASFIAKPPQDCSVIDVDAIELPFAPAKVDNRRVWFISRIGRGVALIATSSAAYRLSDGELSQWSVQREEVLSTRLQAGAKYRASFARDDGQVIWLGGRSGLLDRYEPATGILKTVTASRSELPTWSRLEGSPDGSELFAAGVFDEGGDLHSVVFAELTQDQLGQASWMPTSLQASQNDTTLGIAYEGPRSVLVTRQSTSLIRYRAGVLESVKIGWDLPVLFALARAADGIFVAAAVGEGQASFALLEPDGTFTELGRAAFSDTFGLRALGHGFVFTGIAGWVGSGGTLDGEPIVCAQRLDSSAQDKPAMDTLSEDSFLVGGGRFRSEPSNIYRVRLAQPP